jgi:hypothetical protein
VSPWVSGCSHLYRRVARAFPHEFRMICGDGLERLGEDVVPLVWQQQGAIGVMRLLADLAVHLPYEYFSSWFGKLQEVIMTGDPFEGTWRSIKSEKTQWPAAQPQPQQACLRFEATETGYLMVAYGIVEGQAVAERPQSIIADGRRRPVVDLNGRPIPGVPVGAMAFGSRPDSQTLEVGAEVDGKMLGAGTYKVSPDGRSMTVTTEGMSLKGPFKVTAVFERVVPDPYIPQS